MPATPSDWKESVDEAYAERWAASLGGVPAIIARAQEFEKVVYRMLDERPALLLRYPNRWVGMAPGDAFAVGNTLQEAIANLERTGAPMHSAIVEYMDPDPPVLII